MCIRAAPNGCKRCLRGGVACRCADSEQRARQRLSRQLVICLQLHGGIVLNTVEYLKGAADSYRMVLKHTNDNADPELWVKSDGK